MNNSKKYFIFKDNKLLVKIKDETISIVTELDLCSLNICSANTDFLASKNNEEYFFGEIDSFQNVSSEFQLMNIRLLITSMELSLFNLAAKAFHLIHWNNTYKYCSKCGTLIKNKEDERAKICPSCGLVNYPRISPAIITAVVRDKKLLLAHNVNFPDKRYSVITGFVEPGETFEDCVAREVLEETGIVVKSVKYFGSQPWPFPDSLMVAFTCEYSSGEIKVDGIEIDDAGFYSAEQLPNIPPTGSIARNLIDWFSNNHS
jgi:NAD+ diphosphatase